MDVIKKKYPIIDENNQPSTYPTFASQVFGEDGDNRALWQADKGFYADDSNKLGGVAASEYALKTDTAPNSEMLGGIVASEYAKQADLAKTTIDIKSTTTGSVAYNYSCIINGVKFICIKAIGVTISSGQGPVLCTLNTSFSSEVPIAISTNSSAVCGGWIRSNGEIVVKPNSGSLSNADVRIVGIGW